jgi:hypothetical protein
MKVKYDQVRPLTVVKEFKNQQIDFYDFCFDEENNQINENVLLRNCDTGFNGLTHLNNFIL